MKTISAVIIVLSLIGCTTISPKAKAALAPADNIGDHVKCEQAQCPEYWERAQLWLTKHSQMKIQTVTNVMIQTYNPIGYEVVYGFSVIKEPVGNFAYNIQMTMYCGNPLGCFPEPIYVRNAFYYYVKNGQDLLVGFRWGSIN